MQKIQDTINIYPVDTASQRAILAQIDDNKVTDEAAIKGIVAAQDFSSDLVRQHTLDCVITLLKVGALSVPPVKGNEFQMINTDAPELNWAAIRDAAALDHDARSNSL